MGGKGVRLSRLFKNSRRLFVVPMDHGITIGPVTGLRDMNYTVKQVIAGGADGIIVHKGIAGQIVDHLGPGSGELIIHLSASTALGPNPNRKELVSSVEHAIRLGATAVSVHVNLGDDYESIMLKDLGRVAEKCELWGLPLLAMMYVRDGTRESEYHPAKIKHAARVAEEVGADIIKVNYTGSTETFAEVTGGVKKPVIIAGGPKMNAAYDLLAMVSDAVRAGARGVALGRNVFQAKSPQLLAGKIRRVLDEALSKEEIKELADSDSV